MAVTAVGVKPGSRSAKETQDGVRTYAYTLNVTTDSKGDSAVTLRASGMIPSRYGTYAPPGGSDADPGAKCIGRTFREVGDGSRSWEVDLEYSSSKEATDRTESPLDEPVKYSLQWSSHEKVIEQDINGDPVANTLGDIFTDPPYTEDDDRPVLVAVKNFAAADFWDLVALAQDYKRSVNSDTFHGAAAGTVRLRNIVTGEIQSQNDVDFYRVTFEFEYDPEGWQPEILNRGHRAKDADGNISELPDKQVRNLKEDGTVVAEGEDEYYIPFETREERPYNSLGV